MGGETRHEGARTGGAPLRCPFCHADVDRLGDAWVACERCLAPHHAACWQEGRACAGCGETRSVRGEVTVLGEPVREESRSPAGSVAHELDLRGRNGHFEGESSFVLLAHPGSPESWELRIRNETEKEREVKVRDLPPWLVAAGAKTVLVPPGETRSFVLEIDHARCKLSKGTPETGTLLLAGEEVRPLEVHARVSPELLRAWKSRRVKYAAVAFLLWAAWAGVLFHLRAERMAEFEATGRTVQGVVTKLTPSNHNQMYYFYEVDGVRYERNDFRHAGERVGDSVTITYLPRDPSISVLGTDTTKAGAPGIAMIPFLVFLGVFAAFAISAATLGMPRTQKR